MSQTVPDSSRDVGFCRFHPLWGLSFQHVCQCRIALSNLSHVDKQGTRQELTSGEKKLILQTDQNTPHWILKPAAQAVASIGMALAMVSSSSYNGASRNLEISAKSLRIQVRPGPVLPPVPVQRARPFLLAMEQQGSKARNTMTITIMQTSQTSQASQHRSAASHQWSLSTSRLAGACFALPKPMP